MLSLVYQPTRARRRPLSKHLPLTQGYATCCLIEMRPTGDAAGDKINQWAAQVQVGALFTGGKKSSSMSRQI